MLAQSHIVRDVDYTAGRLMVIVDALWAAPSVVSNLGLPFCHVLLHPPQKAQHRVGAGQSDVSSCLCKVRADNSEGECQPTHSP